MFRERIPLEKRFWSKVNKTKSCWVWKGATKGRGGTYGSIRVHNKSQYAHRVAYELINGPIPDGKDLDHLCRNPLCVNPAHLEPVTNRDNILRGISPTAVNAAKTHCKRGHELNTDNIYISKSGSRQCDLCRKILYARKIANRLHYKCGHRITDRNTFTRSDGQKSCKTCHDKSYQQRKDDRTHCQRGHNFSEPGVVFIRTDGRRQCKICHRVAFERGNEKKRLAKLASRNS